MPVPLGCPAFRSEASYVGLSIRAVVDVSVILIGFEAAVDDRIRCWRSGNYDSVLVYVAEPSRDIRLDAFPLPYHDLCLSGKGIKSAFEVEGCHI